MFAATILDNDPQDDTKQAIFDLREIFLPVPHGLVDRRPAAGTRVSEGETNRALRSGAGGAYRICTSPFRK